MMITAEIELFQYLLQLVDNAPEKFGVYDTTFETIYYLYETGFVISTFLLGGSGQVKDTPTHYSYIIKHANTYNI